MSRMDESVSAIDASSRSTRSTSLRAASILASRLDRRSASSRSDNCPTSAAGGVDAVLTGLNRLRAPLRRPSRAACLYLPCGQLLLVGLCRSGFQFGDGRGALVDIGPQPAPLGQRRDRRCERRIGGRGDHLRLLELLGQRGDLFGGRSRGRQPLGRLRALARDSLELGGERGVRPDRIVDLGDRGCAPGHLVVGVRHPVRRGGPLAGRAAGRCEVPQILRVDPVDQQRLGSGQLDRLTGGDVERPGQRIASGQVHGRRRRRLQHALRLPQMRRRRSRRRSRGPGRVPRPR